MTFYSTLWYIPPGVYSMRFKNLPSSMEFSSLPRVGDIIRHNDCLWDVKKVVWAQGEPFIYLTESDQKFSGGANWKRGTDNSQKECHSE